MFGFILFVLYFACTMAALLDLHGGFVIVWVQKNNMWSRVFGPTGSALNLRIFTGHFISKFEIGLTPRLDIFINLLNSFFFRFICAHGCMRITKN